MSDSVNSSGDITAALPEDWKTLLQGEFSSDYFIALQEFMAHEMKNYQVFPPKEKIFAAFGLTPYAKVKVLLLGQDPYHDDGQAHGLCFSVMPGVKLPPSLRNMFKELDADLKISCSDNGCLEHWAKQGVLLLNTVLTVRAHEAASHQGRGWEQFTDAVIRAVNNRAEPVVFVLWGGHAQKKAALIDSSRHVVISGAHPSPLSAYRGFFGSRPFSKINQALIQSGYAPVDWKIPDRQPKLSLF
ncbi:MAG: uracil-DNA glycosylase [Lentisphaerota bacterium]